VLLHPSAISFRSAHLLGVEIPAGSRGSVDVTGVDLSCSSTRRKLLTSVRIKPLRGLSISAVIPITIATIIGVVRNASQMRRRELTRSETCQQGNQKKHDPHRDLNTVFHARSPFFRKRDRFIQ